MRSPPLGPAVHAVVAAVTLAGVAAVLVARTALPARAPVPFYTFAIPAAVVVVVALLLHAWRRRRWPFEHDTREPAASLRLVIAAAAGIGVGAYTGLLSDWTFDVPMDVVWFTLLPVSVAACGGRGFLRGVVILAALHVGAEIGAQMGYGNPLGVSWTVTRNHLTYVPVSLGGFLAWELVLRRAGRWLGPLPAAPDAESAPRRAR